MHPAHDQDRQAETTQGRFHFLTFVVGREEYGVDVLRVQEIQAWRPVTPVPGTADYISGLTNLHGAVVPVIDLRVRFAMSDADYDASTSVVFVKVKGDRERLMGLVVDDVAEVFGFDPSTLRPTPALDGMDFVDGLAVLEEQTVIVLDVDRMLNTPEVIGSGEEGCVSSR